MSVEVLLSTMNRKDMDFLNNINLETECLVINQCGEDSYFEMNINNNVRIINTSEIGLSRSRNKAIKNARGSICIIADDDLEYIDGYGDVIKNEFDKNPNYDIIAFQVYGKDKKFKKYSNKERKIGYIRSLKLASVEIAFRLQSILDNDIKFDELLGSGAKYSMGEENAFLYECLRSGLKIRYVPVKIADLYVGNSSWFRGFDDLYFISRGASFAGMNKKFSGLLILQFAIRHFKEYKKSISFWRAISMMIKGKREYLSCKC